MDELRKITTELAKIEEGKVKAIAEGDKVYLMIQDAPAELRRLADALEKIDVREIKALVAYVKPGSLKKTSTRVPKPIELAVDLRVEAVVEKFRAKLGKLGVRLETTGGAVRVSHDGEKLPAAVEQVLSEVREALAREVPEVKVQVG